MFILNGSLDFELPAVIDRQENEQHYSNQQDDRRDDSGANADCLHHFGSLAFALCRCIPPR